MAKEGIFNNPIKPKIREADSKYFEAPSKDEANSPEFMGAGCNYGTGVGPRYGSFQGGSVSPIPQKASKTKPPKSLA